jgi:hypothetical protein
METPTASVEIEAADQQKERNMTPPPRVRAAPAADPRKPLDAPCQEGGPLNQDTLIPYSLRRQSSGDHQRDIL